MERKIELILTKPDKHWVGDGFHVRNYFPSGKNLLYRFSPFILLDYNEPEYFAPSLEPRGVDSHPHRGFQTITFAFEGAVEHHDNRSNHGIIYPGDVQWMTAGSGLLHKEYHEKNFSKNGGIFHMIQLWVNLPKASKMVEPSYQAIESKSIPKVKNEDYELQIIAGKYLSHEGIAKTYTPMDIYIVTVKAGKKITLNPNSHYNTGILLLDGSGIMNETRVQDHEFILFENGEGEVSVEAASEDLKFIMLSGEPINEPIMAMGPFVMNTRTEITQAYIDYENGKFGTFDF